MIFHHILSDLVPDFGKSNKKGFKKHLYKTYFLPMEGLIGSTKIQFGMGLYPNLNKKYW